MTIQDWGAIGELIGSFGVLVSLIYLGVQVRQVRQQTRFDSELHLTDQMAKHTEQMARDPDLARLVELANNNPTQLNEDERRRVMWWQVSFLHMCEGLYHRYENNQISRDSWEPYERGLAGLFSTEFLPEWWSTDQNLLYTDSFRSYIDQELPNVKRRWNYPSLASKNDT